MKKIGFLLMFIGAALFYVQNISAACSTKWPYVGTCHPSGDGSEACMNLGKKEDCGGSSMWANIL